MLSLRKNVKIILSFLFLFNPYVHCGDDWLKRANDARTAANISPEAVQLNELKNGREKHCTRKEIRAALKRSPYERVNADAADELAQTVADGLKQMLTGDVAFEKKHKDSIPAENNFIQGGGLFSHPNISKESLIPFSFRVTKVTNSWFSNKTKWVDNLVDDHLVHILKEDNKVAQNTPELGINMEKNPWKQKIGKQRCYIQYHNASHFDYAHAFDLYMSCSLPGVAVKLMSPETDSILVGDNWNTVKNGHGEQILAHVIIYLKHPVEKIISDEDCDHFRNRVNDIRQFSNALLLDAENVTKNAKSAEFISDLIYHATPVFGNMEYRSGLIEQGRNYSTYIELQAVQDETIQEIIGKAVDMVLATKSSDFDLNQTMASWPPASSKLAMNDLSEYDLCLLLTAKNLGLALTRRESKNILVIDYVDVGN